MSVSKIDLGGLLLAVAFVARGGFLPDEAKNQSGGAGKVATKANEI